MVAITDEFMLEMMPKSKNYCIVILKAGPNKDIARVEKTIWEHGRRNFSLRADGLLQIVCPVRDGSDMSGVGIFKASVEDTKRLMDGDLGVKAGVFIYEAHSCRSFPGDCLS